MGTIETTDIYCVCGNTTGFQLSHNVSECTQCTTLITMDTPTYHPRYVKPLEEIAKEQALQDIVMGSFDENGDIADWSTCFEVQCIDDIPW
tara:strand:- start:256 stop:528 length:273 start_codon:yes stop_codon:yes gene_type:complete